MMRLTLKLKWYRFKRWMRGLGRLLAGGKAA